MVPSVILTVSTAHSTALRIKLSEHAFRCYSSDVIYNTASEAQAACAQIALEQGVIEYIKHGNGQVEPSNHERLTAVPSKQRFSVTSLQSFYDSLPQPLPESFGDKSCNEINAPAWLNTLMQSARGGRLAANFVWFTSSDIGSKSCVSTIIILLTLFSSWMSSTSR
jgi:hypothetical protein